MTCDMLERAVFHIAGRALNQLASLSCSSDDDSIPCLLLEGRDTGLPLFRVLLFPLELADIIQQPKIHILNLKSGQSKDFRQHFALGISNHGRVQFRFLCLVQFYQRALFDQHRGQGWVILSLQVLPVKYPSPARKTGSSIAYVPCGKNFIEVFFPFFHDCEKSGIVLGTI